MHALYLSFIYFFIDANRVPAQRRKSNKNVSINTSTVDLFPKHSHSSYHSTHGRAHSLVLERFDFGCIYSLTAAISHRNESQGSFTPPPPDPLLMHVVTALCKRKRVRAAFPCFSCRAQRILWRRAEVSLLRSGRGGSRSQIIVVLRHRRGKMAWFQPLWRMGTEGMDEVIKGREIEL